ncbi:hypothetical protein CKO15_13190 [Halorhodospira abdelmalekii]|uniref:outer membrane protein n=1 Tax=Halorhodospira abdelmalekii TaxID=421629 RepID=UPI001905366E|nr:outer membrane beta-barrel protein [Halorhodospira abdelmalekii]MBK1736205.1 hypothetical protein [Halorhodospira abdelmalekii]
MQWTNRIVAAAATCVAAAASGTIVAQTFTGGYVGVEADLGSSATFERSYTDEYAGWLAEYIVGEEDEVDDLLGTAEVWVDAIGSTQQYGTTATLPGGGVFAGGGVQNDGFYFGGEARYRFGGFDDDYVEETDENLELEDGYAISGRLGTVLRDGNVMLYASAGYTEREVTLEVGDEDMSEDASGHRLSAGIEYRPADMPMLVRFEAARSDYGDVTYAHDLVGGEDIIEIDDLVEDTAHLGVGYTF